MPVSASVRRQVMEYFGHECQIFHGRPTEAGELCHCEHQGAGGLPEDHPLNQKENLLPGCGQCHSLFHGPGIPYQIVEFKLPEHPTDTGSLEVIDREGRRVPHERLWFYQRRHVGEVKRAVEQVQHLASTARTAQWALGWQLAYLKEHGEILQAIADTDVYGVALEAGLSSAEVKRLVRVWRWAQEMGLDCKELDPVVADRLRKVPDEELAEVFAEVRALSKPDVYRLLNDRYGSGRMRTFRIFRAPEYREVRALSEDEVEYAPGEVVVRGGSVIAGIGKEANDA